MQCTATDKDGNTASDGVTLKIDSIKPTVQVTPPDTPGANFQFTFSEPVDIDPKTQSPPVIETDSASGFFGQLSLSWWPERSGPLRQLAVQPGRTPVPWRVLRRLLPAGQRWRSPTRRATR